MKALNETNTISTIPVLYKAWRKCNEALKCDVFLCSFFVYNQLNPMYDNFYDK